MQTLERKVYNNILKLEDVKSKIKPLEKGAKAIIRLNEEYFHPVDFQPGVGEGGKIRYGASTKRKIVGAYHVLNQWNILFDGEVYNCGFFTGNYDKNGDAIFASPVIANGELELDGNIPKDREMYLLFQIHPQNKSGIFPSQGNTAFYEYNPEAIASVKVDMFVEQSEAVIALKGMSDADRDYVCQLAEVGKGMVGYERLQTMIRSGREGLDKVKKAMEGVHAAKLKDAVDYTIGKKVLVIDPATSLVTFNGTPLKGIDIKDVPDSQKISQLLFLLLKNENSKAANDIIKKSKDLREENAAMSKSAL